jgi:hypothetical protein
MTARINLAPEVYQTSQRNKRRKRLATTITTVTAFACGGLIIILLLIIVSQKGALVVIQNNIKKSQKDLMEMPDLQRALTVQHHLKSWDKLYNEKTYMSEFFRVLETYAPQGVAVGNIDVSEENILTVSAAAQNYALATKFAKALDAANVEIGPNASLSATPYFTGTELASVSQESNNSVTFKLTTQMSSEVTRAKN